MPPRKTPSKKKATGDGGYTPWTATAAEVCAELGVDPETGLDETKIAKLRSEYGFNELDKEEGKPLWKLVLEQFDDALVKILLVAALVSFVLAFTEERAPGVELSLVDFVEPGVILLILVLNAIVGVWQESNAESALEALKEMQSETARCLRAGEWISDLPARELVPGDVVEVRTGDRVPADCRVIRLKTATIRLEQASLTGESVAVNKTTEPVADAGCELQGKECVLFGGTSVSQGACVAAVIDTGMRTEIGKIQAQIQAAAEEEDDTPLKQKLDTFGDQLTLMIGVICLLVWLMNYHFFISWKWGGLSDPFSITEVDFNFAKCTFYFKIAVALAVAAIPEGLPAVITTCLALGTRKMAKKNAIVRKLQSVETLGCTSVICSDKTGTLTTNNMSAVRLVVPSGGGGGSKTTSKTPSKRKGAGAGGGLLTSYEVQGTSYDPSDGGVVGLVGGSLDACVTAVSRVCVMCNESTVELKDGAFRCAGEPTEGALKVLAEKIGVADAAANAKIVKLRAADPAKGCQGVADHHAAQGAKLATLEFDRGRKSMSVIVADGGKGSNKNSLLVKGAPECVLDRCSKVLLPDGSVTTLSPALREEIVATVAEMSSSALRCLGFALKTGVELGKLGGYDGGEQHPAHKDLMDPGKYESIESDLTFCGLAGLRDPPRPEVRGAIDACKTAGIRVVVITGDNKLTAEAICADIGIFDSPSDAVGRSFTGREFSDMPLAKKKKLLATPGGCVFSRAEPKHKQDIVRLLKEADEIVAMTGDGVNDAPALKLADIGIAMGITGTAVAKEASDMVLADDNFSSIVDAISEGRSIYNNMKAFIRYMISSNVGEVVSIFLTAALGMPEGLIPVQLLWVNLVTDGPPATALGFNPPDVDIMTKKPRRKDEDLISTWAMVRYLVVGLYVGAATVGIFAVWYTKTEFLGIDLAKDGHTPVTWHQLTHWGECETWKGFAGGKFTAGGVTYSYTGSDACDYFHAGKIKASTLSLTTLVVIEMFNACNALSEDISLVIMPPWINPWLILAMFSSFALHFLILYVPALATIFSIVPLDLNEWLLVCAAASPVWIIDEILKFIGRNFVLAGR